MWSQILLVLISLFCCIIIYRRMKGLVHLELLAYSICLGNAVYFSLILMQIPALSYAIELIHLGLLLLILILLLLSIRKLQPMYARHPILYSYIPLIVLPFYIFFIDNEVLSTITFIALQGTSLVVFGGLVAIYFQSVQQTYLLLSGFICLTFAVLFQWMLNEEITYGYIFVHLFTGAGMVMTALTLPELIHKQIRQ